MSKIGLLVAGGVGYVLGTRAGREQYAKIKEQAQELWQSPKVQDAKSKATDAVSSASSAASAKVGQARSNNGASSGNGSGDRAEDVLISETPASNSMIDEPLVGDVSPARSGADDRRRGDAGDRGAAARGPAVSHPAPQPGEVGQDGSAEPSVGQLLSRLSEQTSRLVRDEILLAKTELATTAKKAGTGAGLLGGAGVLALYGGGALVATIIILLALVMSLWLAALIVTVVLFVIAAVAALLGRSQLKQASPHAGNARCRTSAVTSRRSRRPATMSAPDNGGARAAPGSATRLERRRRRHRARHRADPRRARGTPSTHWPRSSTSRPKRVTRCRRPRTRPVSGCARPRTP